MKATEKNYFVGVSLRNNKKTALVTMTTNKDFLPCDIYDYWDNCTKTKKQVKAQKWQLLSGLKQNSPQIYGQCNSIVIE